MHIFQQNQLDKLSEIQVFQSHIHYLQKIIHELNTKKIVIVSGHHRVGKLSLIKELLIKTQQINNVFLVNKDFVLNEKIDGKILINILNESLKYNKNIKIIVLNNFNKILNIKHFIQYIHTHKNKFKIILIGNSIQIPGVTEIEYLPDNRIVNQGNTSLEDSVYYGSVIPSHLLSQNYLKKLQLDLIVNETYLNEIFINFGVKDIELYHFTMTYLSKISYCLSLRELHKGLTEIQQITLKTTIDYINFSIRAKIIKPVYRYDFKKQKQISSRVQYYFTDIGIRNSISKYSLSQRELKENFLYQELAYQGYEIQSGLNGTFDFTFYCKKSSENLCFHYSQITEKNELKKEINKLNKVPVAGKKYLIVDSIELFGIKKLKYDDVEIIEYENIFQNLR